MIAVLGRLLAAPHRVDGGAEAIDLRAGVVAVVLALDRVAGEGEQPRHRVAVGAVAGRRDRDRACRVGGHQLHLHALRGRRGAGAEAIACREQLRQRRRVPLVGEEDVEEARARHLDSLDAREGADCLGERLRDLAWRLAALTGEPQRDVRRIVAVRGIGGPLERDRRAGGVRERGGERRDGITLPSLPPPHRTARPGSGSPDAT